MVNLFSVRKGCPFQGWLLRYKSVQSGEPAWIRLGKIHANDDSSSLVAVGEVRGRLVGRVENPAT
jgi:hypothetical protein